MRRDFAIDVGNHRSIRARSHPALATCPRAKREFKIDFRAAANLTHDRPKGEKTVIANTLNENAFP